MIFRIRLAWRAFSRFMDRREGMGKWLLIEFLLSCAADLVILGHTTLKPIPLLPEVLFPFAIIPVTLFIVFLACCFFPRVTVKCTLGYFEVKESALDFTKS